MGPILNGYGAMVVFYFHKCTANCNITCTSMPFLQSDLHSQDKMSVTTVEEYPSNYDKPVL